DVRLHLDNLSLTEFRRAGGEEIVVLAQSQIDYAAQARDSTEIEYDDTSDTIRFREEIRKINDHLACADVAYVGGSTDKNGRLIDASPSGRFLRRVFNVPAGREIRDSDKRFDRGGRLFHRGTFWQGLSSDQRQHIRINGEP